MIDTLLDRARPHLGLILTLALLSAVFVAGWVLGVPAGVLVLAGGSFIGVIALFWSSLRTLFGETPLSGVDALVLAAPRAEEEKKRAVLRALKDIEYERTVGKISEDDYQALVAQYRGEAKRLLRALDQAALPQREKAEALLADRLAREGITVAKGTANSGGPKNHEPEADEPEADEPEADEPEADEAGEVEREADEPEADEDEAAAATGEPARTVCTSCTTKNDEDATFCKKCGARLTGEEQSDAQA